MKNTKLGNNSANKEAGGNHRQPCCKKLKTVQLLHARGSKKPLNCKNHKCMIFYSFLMAFMTSMAVSFYFSSFTVITVINMFAFTAVNLQLRILIQHPSLFVQKINSSKYKKIYNTDRQQDTRQNVQVKML